MPGSQSIQGLASNLDTNAIVQAIMAAEHRVVDRLTERQTEATNRMATYNSISALMVALRSALAPLLRTSTFEAATLSVSDQDAISATTSGQVAAGTYFLSVDALATNHQIASQGFDDPATAILGNGTLQIRVGSGSTQTITIDSTNNSLTGLKNAINAARVGVTASIINDGSSSQSYRLMLTANETGAENTITVTTNLSGGLAPDFASSTFDAVERLPGMAGTALVSVGPTASYSGAANKTYTFTVAGSGTQTIGDAPITVNWTDGTNSGSFEVAAADSEVALTGTGSDGLKLTFGGGTLTAGDQFRVQTFAPLLQKAADAQVRFGSGSDGASPIVVASASNQIKDLIAGLTINLKNVTSTPVTITAAVDQTAIEGKINDFLAKYNEVMRTIDKQFSYNSETQEAGLLIGDQFLMAVQSQLRGPLASTVAGLPKGMNTLRALGIRTGADGLLSLASPSTLSDKLATDLSGVMNLFTDSGTSTNALISFLSAGTKSVESQNGYDVEITQAATRGQLRGLDITDPATTPLELTSDNNSFRLVVDGIRSDPLTLSLGTFNSGSALAAEIQDKINHDDAIGSRGVTVSWVDLGDTGYLQFTSGGYGSASRLSVEAGDAGSAVSVLGFSGGGAFTAGADVAGTINGEAATGSGQILTGNAGNATTAGLRLEVRLTPSQVTGGTSAVITFVRGFASRIDRIADSLSRASDGSISRYTQGIQNQIDDLKAQITSQEERLAIRQEKLYERFTALEQALSQFQTQGDFLSQQLAQISANTNAILKR
ncbi:MAG: flagellar filament capping protein FliD [Candidatus Zixiibacteriota bacterium]